MSDDVAVRFLRHLSRILQGLKIEIDIEIKLFFLSLLYAYLLSKHGSQRDPQKNNNLISYFFYSYLSLFVVNWDDWLLNLDEALKIVR